MRIITVKGTGNVSARPDYIILSLNIEVLSESFNRFLIISLDVLICRYSLLLQAFPAFFIVEDTLKSSYIPVCFCVQK